ADSRTPWPPVARRARAGVPARAYGAPRPRARPSAQQLATVLVRAVLTPHRAEHGPLETVRLSSDDLSNTRGFGLGQSDLDVGGRGGASPRLSVRLRRFRPRDRRGRAHERPAPPPTKRSTWCASAPGSSTRVGF